MGGLMDGWRDGKISEWMDRVKEGTLQMSSCRSGTSYQRDPPTRMGCYRQVRDWWMDRWMDGGMER